MKLQEIRMIRKKRNTFDSVSALYKGHVLTLNAFKSIIFPIKETKGNGLHSDLARVDRLAKVSNHSNPKTLTPNQMLQRLLIALAQIKAGNTSENLLN